jgi:hypothetical protein
MRTISLLAAVASTLVACSDAETSGELCAAICDYDKECNGETTCGECELDESKVRPEAEARWIECYQSLTCSDNEDVCVFFAANGVSVRDIDDSYDEGCRASVETCGIIDDYCGMSPLFEAEYVEAAIACFAGRCEAVEDCLDRALAR